MGFGARSKTNQLFTAGGFLVCLAILVFTVYRCFSGPSPSVGECVFALIAFVIVAIFTVAAWS